MKKILLSLGLIGLGLISFCSADYSLQSFSGGNIIENNYTNGVFGSFDISSDPYSVYCLSGYFNSFSTTSTSTTTSLKFSFGNDSTSVVDSSDTYLFPSYQTMLNNHLFICVKQNSNRSFNYLNLFKSSPGITVSFDFDYTLYKLVSSSSSSCDYSDYELKSNITESYCTNKFSTLIDESDITSGYCETQFGLIDPENCPASGGSGDVNWSSFFVNSHQVEGASNIYLYLPDFLNWDYTYLNSGATLEINVENQGDEDYINSLLAVETFHPSSEDFTQSFTGTITLLMPYIIIVLFILFIWKLIKRIFK